MGSQTITRAEQVHQKYRDEQKRKRRKARTLLGPKLHKGRDNRLH